MHSQVSFTPCQYPQITLRKLAQLLKVYNTNWSEGAIAGVLTDMVKEIREQTLMGNTVNNVKLLAQATGAYTRAELNKDAVLGWSTFAEKMINDAKQSVEP